MRIEYELGLTLVASFLVVLCSLILKLLFLLPSESADSKAKLSIMSSNIEMISYPPKPSLLDSQQYKQLYKESIENPSDFWGQTSRELLSWSKPFTTVYQAGKGEGGFDGFKWFPDGQLNAAYNAVDRHAQKNPNRTALIWESDDPQITPSRIISYEELLEEVKCVASYLRTCGVKKGDVVTIYMPMIPEAIFAMLGCARIGAVHNVVFGGFGWESLRDRINDAQSSILVTASEGRRGGKVIDLKGIVDHALMNCSAVKRVIVYKHSPNDTVVMQTDRDVFWHDSVSKADSSKGELVNNIDSEDPLFLLYTSGSTGRPKALVHTTGGYLTFAAHTFKLTFDYDPDQKDVYFCTADIGWITGHSYVVYGPLINGATVLIFEGIATYPSASRLWEIINTHQVTQFYTAPTLLRLLKRLGDDPVLDCPSLRVLGSVGEPIDAKAWNWLYHVIGKGKCSVVDTYWQTETGGHVLVTIPGTAACKPGAAGFPFMGILPEIVPAHPEHPDKGVLVIKRPWPGMARTVFRDHQRYISTYLTEYPGYYFTGDGAHKDSDGYYWVHGRVDDVINVSGHRFATAEIEGVLTKHPYCAEAAVLGKADELTGQSIYAFCLLKAIPSEDHEQRSQIEKELCELVRSSIGHIATPRSIIFPSDLPKTRSGKIMRRVLRKILAGEGDLGDLSTLTNPHIIEELRLLIRAK